MIRYAHAIAQTEQRLGLDKILLNIVVDMLYSVIGPRVRST